LSSGRVHVLVQLRPSSEGLPRPRAPGAKDRHGRPSNSSRSAGTGDWPDRPASLRHSSAESAFPCSLWPHESRRSPNYTGGLYPNGWSSVSERRRISRVSLADATALVGVFIRFRLPFFLLLAMRSA